MTRDINNDMGDSAVALRMDSSDVIDADSSGIVIDGKCLTGITDCIHTSDQLEFSPMDNRVICKFEKIARICFKVKKHEECNENNNFIYLKSHASSKRSCLFIFLQFFHSPRCKSILTALFFAVCSLMSTFTHKLVMTNYSFQFPAIIMLCQTIAVLAFLKLLSACRALSRPDMTLASMSAFILPATCFAFYTSLALSALSHMNVAIYTMLRRTVPIATLILGIPLLNKGCPSITTIVAVNLLSSSCIVAGYGDLQFDPMTYVCGLASNFTQALYFIFIQKHCEDYSIIATLQHNAVLTIPILLAIAVATGELHSVFSYAYLHTASFHIVFALQLLVGSGLSISIVLCTGTNCALTTSVVGSIKALVQTLIGVFAFDDTTLTMLVFIGIVINFCGSILFIYSKYAEDLKRKKFAMIELQTFSVDRKS